MKKLTLIRKKDNRIIEGSSFSSIKWNNEEIGSKVEEKIKNKLVKGCSLIIIGGRLIPYEWLTTPIICIYKNTKKLKKFKTKNSEYTLKIEDIQL